MNAYGAAPDIKKSNYNVGNKTKSILNRFSLPIIWLIIFLAFLLPLVLIIVPKHNKQMKESKFLVEYHLFITSENIPKNEILSDSKIVDELGDIYKTESAIYKWIMKQPDYPEKYKSDVGYLVQSKVTEARDKIIKNMKYEDVGKYDITKTQLFVIKNKKLHPDGQGFAKDILVGLSAISGLCLLGTSWSAISNK